MNKVTLRKKEIKNLMDEGYIFNVGKNKYRFLDKDEPDVEIIENE